MTWWQRLWRRRKMEEQLEKELRFHLDQHASELIAQGHSPNEAQRQARLALGGPEQVKEKCRDARGTRWLEDLLQDTRYALRTFRQKPGFTAIALLLLALGIGATTVMFAVVNSVLLRPLSYPEPDRLVTLRVFTEQIGELWGFSNLDFGDAKRESLTLALAAWTYGGGTISEPREAEYVNGRQISAELFSTLGISPVQGRAFRPDEDRPGAAPVAIISYGLWQRDFGGEPSAIGKSLVYDGKPYTVVGIAPVGFQLDGEADVFTPLEPRQNTDPRMQNRRARFLRVLGRLRPGFGLAEGGAEHDRLPAAKGAGRRCRLDALAAPVRGRPRAAHHLRECGESPAGARGFTRAGACHACSTGSWAQPPGASMPYRKRNLRPWRRRARRSTRIRQHSPICCVLARQLAACGRGPSGLAGTCFRRGCLAFERPSFRAGAGSAV